MKAATSSARMLGHDLRLARETRLGPEPPLQIPGGAWATSAASWPSALRAKTRFATQPHSTPRNERRDGHGERRRIGEVFRHVSTVPERD